MRILLIALQAGLLTTAQHLPTVPEPWIKTLPVLKSIDPKQLNQDVSVEVAISADGTPQSCKPFIWSQPEAVVSLACDRMMRAIFVSERDSRGQPIPSVWTGWVSISRGDSTVAISAPSGEINKSKVNWVTSDGYPKRALRYELEGTTRFRVLVGTSGRVMTCQITVSSGHEVLDNATCQNVSRNARFTPAVGSDGNAVASYFEGLFRYQIPAKKPKSRLTIAAPIQLAQPLPAPQIHDTTRQP
jgi:TonB family protein